MVFILMVEVVVFLNNGGKVLLLLSWFVIIEVKVGLRLCLFRL